jgi:hypothetical protein
MMAGKLMAGFIEILFSAPNTELINIIMQSVFEQQK